MTEKKYPSDKQDKFMLRFPEGMRERIRESSEKAGRSMNAEIIARLEESLAPSAFESAELPSAEHLRAASASALESLRESVWQHATRELFSVARVGKVICPLDLSDVPGFDGDNEEHQAIAEWLEGRLKEKGFVTSHEEPGEIVVFWGEESK